MYILSNILTPNNNYGNGDVYDDDDNDDDDDDDDTLLWQY